MINASDRIFADKRWGVKIARNERVSLPVSGGKNVGVSYYNTKTVLWQCQAVNRFGNIFRLTCFASARISRQNFLLNVQLVNIKKIN